MRLKLLLIPLAMLLLLVRRACPAGRGEAGADQDLVDIDGVRGNDLLGYGLVVGLNNSGDSLAPAPRSDVVTRLRRQGAVATASGSGRGIGGGASAATAFARAGSQIGVTVPTSATHRPARRHAGDDAAQCRRRSDLCGGGNKCIAAASRPGQAASVARRTDCPASSLPARSERESNKLFRHCATCGSRCPDEPRRRRSPRRSTRMSA